MSVRRRIRANTRQGDAVTPKCSGVTPQLFAQVVFAAQRQDDHHSSVRRIALPARLQNGCCVVVVGDESGALGSGPLRLKPKWRWRVLIFQATLERPQPITKSRETAAEAPRSLYSPAKCASYITTSKQPVVAKRGWQDRFSRRPLPALDADYLKPRLLKELSKTLVLK